MTGRLPRADRRGARAVAVVDRAVRSAATALGAFAASRFRRALVRVVARAFADFFVGGAAAARRGPRTCPGSVSLPDEPEVPPEVPPAPEVPPEVPEVPPDVVPSLPLEPEVPPEVPPCPRFRRRCRRCRPTCPRFRRRCRRCRRTSCRRAARARRTELEPPLPPLPLQSPEQLPPPSSQVPVEPENPTCRRRCPTCRPRCRTCRPRYRTCRPRYRTCRRRAGRAARRAGAGITTGLRRGSAVGADAEAGARRAARTHHLGSEPRRELVRAGDVELAGRHAATGDDADDAPFSLMTAPPVLTVSLLDISVA